MMEYDMSKGGFVQIPVEMYDKLKTDSNELATIKDCKLIAKNLYGGESMVIRPDAKFVDMLNNLLKTKFEEQFGDKDIKYEEISEYSLRVAQFMGRLEDDKDERDDEA